MAGVLQGLFGDSPSASPVPGGNGDDAGNYSTFSVSFSRVIAMRQLFRVLLHP
jgi:hypothetical protein